MPIDYKNGKIYKMISPSGLVYVGSTCQSLAVRKAKHKRSYNCWKRGTYHYVTSFKLFDESLDNIDIVLLENFQCSSKEELHSRERHFIDSLECVNKTTPCRTKKEYRVEKKDELNEKKRQHYSANKDRLKSIYKEYYDANKKVIQEQHSQYYEKNKEAIDEYRLKYRIDNHDLICEKKRKHYDANKERIRQEQAEYRKANSEKLKEKIVCGCGSEYRKDGSARHYKTMMHKQWQQQQEQQQQPQQQP
jgi:hypothetical protein